MDELDNLAADPLGSPAPGPSQIATALDLIAGLLATEPVRTQTWERRDHGNGLPYRIWDALPVVHTVATTHLISEADAVHAVQAAVRQVKTDDEVIDVLVEHLGDLGVANLRDFLGRTLELETHHPLNLGAYALSAVDSDAMQAAYARTATALRDAALAAEPAAVPEATRATAA
ncbi:hypothetical protein P5P86_06240 [Nocardioides sp. BP30]|uniref:hypothetical protein n=1 Tax=Nocardioides sp. BP30 TaxID=3036374 RepID=UPI002469A756|nr:hypothetical protein [Nocardioides sp. BP30]WGL53426.1 hypothetical protein P5P86_06240 [Nocardioides sp. BP30]